MLQGGEFAKLASDASYQKPSERGQERVNSFAASSGAISWFRLINFTITYETTNHR
jgi:hypothetical protein